MPYNTQDLRIESIKSLRSPEELSALLPLLEEDKKRICSFRESVSDILTGKDERMLCIVGPCSIHDPKAALDYAGRLKDLSDRISSEFFVIMRTYFEKPRTALGWKGLIADPDMDESYDIEKGLEICRRLLLDITRIGLPVGCECLDPIVPQYTDELMSWSSIGARTTESQIHRAIASGLSVPVGFKNSTSGDYSAAINAAKSAMVGAAFIGVKPSGEIARYMTKGNPYTHIILRGGVHGPNYHENDVESAERDMRNAGLEPRIVIDCSHANSNKDYTRQKRVLRSIIDQKAWGNKSIKGFMLESNIHEGNQKIPHDLSSLEYGVSVTDACIGWEETERILLNAKKILVESRKRGTEDIL